MITKLIAVLDIQGIKRSLWIFISDYILFLDNELFALFRGFLFNAFNCKFSIAYIYKNCDFYSFSNIKIGKKSVVKKGCRLNGPIKIGNYATIAERVVITGPSVIGERCLVNYGAWIDKYVELEDGAIVAHKSFLISFTHDYCDPLFRAGGEIIYAPIRIGRGAWVGANVVILKGVTIGQGAIIGAGSVVTKDIPDNVMAAGNPCRVIKQI